LNAAYRIKIATTKSTSGRPGSATEANTA
jgi:hypothetical protein